MASEKQTEKKVEKKPSKYAKFFEPKKDPSFVRKLGDANLQKLIEVPIWNENISAYQGKPLKQIEENIYLKEKVNTHHALNNARQKHATELTLSADISLRIPIQPTIKKAKADQEALALDKKGFNLFVNFVYDKILNSPNFNLLKEKKIVYGSAFALINFNEWIGKNNNNLTNNLPLPDVTIITPENIFIDGVDTFDKARWMFYVERISFFDLRAHINRIAKGFKLSREEKDKWNEKIEDIMETGGGILKSVSTNFALFTEHLVDYFIIVANTQMKSPQVDIVTEYEYDEDDDFVNVNIYVGYYLIGSVKTTWKVIPIVPLYDIEELGRIFGRSQMQVEIINQNTLDTVVSYNTTRQLLETFPMIALDVNAGINANEFAKKYNEGQASNVFVVDGNPQEAIFKLPVNPTAGQITSQQYEIMDKIFQNSSGVTPAYQGILGSATSGTASQQRIAMATKIDQFFISHYRNFIHRLWPVLLDQWRNIIKTKDFTIWYVNPNQNSPEDEVYIKYDRELLDYEWMLHIDDIQFGKKDQLTWQTAVQVAQMTNLFPGTQLISPKQFVSLAPLPYTIKSALLEQLELTDQQILLHKAADVIKVVVAALHTSAQAIGQQNPNGLVNNLPQMIAQMIASYTPASTDDALAQQAASQQQAAAQQAQGQPQGVGGNDTLNQNGSQFNPQQQGGQ